MGGLAANAHLFNGYRQEGDGPVGKPDPKLKELLDRPLLKCPDCTFKTPVKESLERHAPICKAEREEFAARGGQNREASAEAGIPGAAAPGAPARADMSQVRKEAAMAAKKAVEETMAPMLAEIRDLLAPKAKKKTGGTRGSRPVAPRAAPGV